MGCKEKKEMKKILVLLLTCLLSLSLFAQGAKENDQISVISREDGSGTRGAFTELMGILDSNKVDMTTVDAAITNSTSVMMTTVAGNKNAIGYISLGSLNDTVKAVTIDGVEPTTENIINGTYKVARPFNIVVTDNISDLAKDFISFILSKEGQAVISKSYIPVAGEESYSGKKLSGKLVIAGSSSVTPIMEKLKEAYNTYQSDVQVEVQQSDSSTGVKSALSGICDIGMASRNLKSSEVEKGAKNIVIAQDGIAVIVSTKNIVNGLTSEMVKDIYLGSVKSWSELQ